jgi:hypothetical protein
VGRDQRDHEGKLSFMARSSRCDRGGCDAVRGDVPTLAGVPCVVLAK